MDVQLYVGGKKDAGGILFKTIKADQPTEPAIYAYCGNGSAKHRFVYYLTNTDRTNYANQEVHAYSLSPDGQFTSLIPLHNTNTVRIPPPATAPPANSCSLSVPCTSGMTCSLNTGTPTSMNQAWVKGAANCGFNCINNYTGNTCATPPTAPPANSCSVSVPCTNGVNCRLSTGAPTSVNQAWVKAATNCGFTCINNYTGNTCATPPTAPPANSCSVSVPCTSGVNCSLTTGTPTSVNQTWVKDAANCGFTCINNYTGNNCEITAPTPINSCSTNIPCTNGVNCSLTTGSPASVNQTWVKSAANCGYTCLPGHSGAQCEVAATGSISVNSSTCSIPGAGYETGVDAYHCSVYVSWQTNNGTDIYVKINGMVFGHAAQFTNAHAPWISATEDAVFILQDGDVNGKELARVSARGVNCAIGTGNTCDLPDQLVDNGWIGYTCDTNGDHSAWCQDPPATLPFLYKAIDKGLVAPNTSICNTFCHGQNICHEVNCQLWKKVTGKIQCDGSCQ